MTVRVAAGGVAVTVQGDAVEEAEGVLGRLTSDGVPAALTAGNASLWGPEAAEGAAERLGWVNLPETSRGLLPGLAGLRARFAGLDRVLLAAVDGSALAAAVAARAHGVELTPLDGVDPHHVRRVLGSGASLDRTVLVVAAEDGGTVETDAHLRVFRRACRDAGLDPAEHVIVVTGPGSALEAAAKEAGHPTVLADPEVSGRYGALSAYALVPAALAGADAGRLLDEAAALAPALRLSYDNPGLVLGAALGGAATAGHGTLVLAERAPGAGGIGAWVEQLVAGATGKDGTGLLPVLVEDVTAPEFGSAGDVRRVVLGERPGDAGLAVSGPPGAQFLLWEYAVAVAARIIGVDPFGEPAAREAGAVTAALLRGSERGETPALVVGEPALIDDAVEVHGPAEVLQGARDLPGAIDALLGAVPERGYLAVTAYLDPVGDAAAAALRPALARYAARRRPVPVTFGWAPRHLYTTGQYHRDGPPTGVFLQITGAVTDDVEVPGRPYGLAALQLAQAFGDARALRGRGRPVVRLHLRDRAAGLARIAAALGGRAPGGRPEE